LQNNLRDTETTVETIRQIRLICQKFEERGLPNFPSGIPFTFWEQYLHLRSWISVGLVCILAAVFLAISLLMMNPWIAAISVVVIATIVVQWFGAMGILGIKLSAVPAIIVIVAVGLGVEFTAHICMVSRMI
jgi:patched 1 protein